MKNWFLPNEYRKGAGGTERVSTNVTTALLNRDMMFLLLALAVTSLFSS